MVNGVVNCWYFNSYHSLLKPNFSVCSTFRNYLTQRTGYEWSGELIWEENSFCAAINSIQFLWHMAQKSSRFHWKLFRILINPFRKFICIFLFQCYQNSKKEIEDTNLVVSTFLSCCLFLSGVRPIDAQWETIPSTTGDVTPCLMNNFRCEIISKE